jgi:hypothetical protein
MDKVLEAIIGLAIGWYGMTLIDWASGFRLSKYLRGMGERLRVR